MAENPNKICYMLHTITRKPIILKYMEEGYFDHAPQGIDVDAYNEALGLPPDVVDAMLHGSMFGWNTPGAKAAHEFFAETLEEYEVVWRVQLSATSPRAAAIEAQKMHRDQESTANVFEVDLFRRPGHAETIDLDEEETDGQE